MVRPEEFHSPINSSERAEDQKVLPITAAAAEIKEAVIQNDVVIVVGETGSGKTTQLPLMLLDTLDPGDKIAVTQPRRMAARSISRYVASELGGKVGEEVGYRVRFDDHTTEGARINFMTDGILLRLLHDDPLLETYSAVMVDEVHERSLNIDFTLGMLKKIQQQRQERHLKPLKIVVASATLEKEKLAAYFNAPVIEVSGRLYPVDVHYEEQAPTNITQTAAVRIADIIAGKKEGDVLTFVSGQDAITRVTKDLQKELENRGLRPPQILPLHSQIPPEEQDKVFAPGERKVIIATNIAETSLTVPGVQYVVDTGIIKRTEFNPQTGIESLVERPHAKSGCIQRAGRAGRVQAGECYRLYTEADFAARQEFELPEIQRSNLAHVVLEMKKLGITNIHSFDFIDRPSKDMLDKALENLTILGALDEDGRLTETGRIMAELPLKPELARMVIEAQKHGCVAEVATIAAFLGSDKPVYVRPRDEKQVAEADQAHQQFNDPSSDFLTLLNVWNAYGNNRNNYDWAYKNYLNNRALAEARDVRSQLLQSLGRHRIISTSNPDPEAIGKSIAAGLIGNLMERSGQRTFSRVIDPGNPDAREIFLHPSSILFQSNVNLFVTTGVVETSRTFARVCQAVKPEWLTDIAPSLVRETARDISYDPEADKVTRSITYRLSKGHTTWQELQDVHSSEAAMALLRYLEETSPEINSILRHNQDVANKIQTLWIRSGGKTPKLNQEQVESWLVGRLNGVSSMWQLKELLKEHKIDLRLNFDEFIPLATRNEIIRDNPDELNVGDMSYPVTYHYETNDQGEDVFYALVRIPAKNLYQLSALPEHPSGRSLRITCTSEVGEIEASSLAEAQQKARKLVIIEEWDRWRRSEAGLTAQKDIQERDIYKTIKNLPEPIQYTQDPLTGEAVYAYPGIEFNLFRNSYRIIYFTDQADAKRSLEELG